MTGSTKEVIPLSGIQQVKVKQAPVNLSAKSCIDGFEPVSNSIIIFILYPIISVPMCLEAYVRLILHQLFRTRVL